MPYPAKAIANEFLELAKRDGKKLTPMQIQKLVYFAYGWYLAITGEYLVNERVEAWQWGPVFPSLYREFRRFGSEPITELASEAVVRNQSGHIRLVLTPVRLDNDSEKSLFAHNVINKVWQVYGNLSGSQLSNLTHAKDSPWSLTPNKEISGTDIPDNLIKQYFREIALKK